MPLDDRNVAQIKVLQQKSCNKQLFKQSLTMVNSAHYSGSFIGIV